MLSLRRTALYLSVAALGELMPPASAIGATVQNCNDSGPGSLREAIVQAASNETIDLSQLTTCGTASSVITLTSGELEIPQAGLKLQGPSTGALTIEGSSSNPSRIIDHTGSGLLVLNDLRFAKGNLQTAGSSAAGGCIYSKGTVFITRSTVEDCKAEGDGASGGGIYSHDSALLLSSVVSSSKALSLSAASGVGGGVFARTGLVISYSALDGNEASTLGGAAFIDDSYQGAYTTISNSTISGNSSRVCAGATLYSPGGVTIANTTVSGNVASGPSGGLCVSGNVVIANSTLAFNAAAGQSGALIAWSGSLLLLSDIFSNNSGAADAVAVGSTSVSGSDNLIVSSDGVPMSVITSTNDAKLMPLAHNGGQTRTHAMAHDSPARAAGNNLFGSWMDQRGRGYPRTSGNAFDVDMGALQFDSIFYSDNDP